MKFFRPCLTFAYQHFLLLCGFNICVKENIFKVSFPKGSHSFVICDMSRTNQLFEAAAWNSACYSYTMLFILNLLSMLTALPYHLNVRYYLNQ